MAEGGREGGRVGDARCGSILLVAAGVTFIYLLFRGLLWEYRFVDGVIWNGTKKKKKKEEREYWRWDIKSGECFLQRWCSGCSLFFSISFHELGGKVRVSGICLFFSTLSLYLNFIVRAPGTFSTTTWGSWIG